MNPVVYLGNNELMFVRKYKYLGHVIDDNLKDDTDMHIQAGKLYARGNMLLRKFHLISDEAKILLFKSFCTMYIAVVYGARTMHHFWIKYEFLIIIVSEYC